jgi:hypothetical protein
MTSLRKVPCKLSLPLVPVMVQRSGGGAGSGCQLGCSSFVSSSWQIHREFIAVVYACHCEERFVHEGMKRTMFNS